MCSCTCENRRCYPARSRAPRAPSINHGLKRLETLPVSIRLIFEIHAELLQGVRGNRLTPGELRRSQNWIGPGACTLATATYVPLPPEELPEALGALERFLHEQNDLPALIRIGLAHAQFETIHPFLDGNGRVRWLPSTC